MKREWLYNEKIKFKNEKIKFKNVTFSVACIHGCIINYTLVYVGDWLQEIRKD